MACFGAYAHPCNLAMLKPPTRIVPQWKSLKTQVLEKLELQKVVPSLPEAAEATHILLSDRPTIIFRASCFPSLMPIICFYSLNTASYFASFTWRITKGNKNKVRAWVYNLEEDAQVIEKDYVLAEDPQVLNIVYVPCRKLFVTYCEDIHIRLFSDHQEDLKLIYEMISPYLITSACYNPETKDLVTGSIGVVAFWSFDEEENSSLSVTHEVHLAGGEFVHALSVEQEGRVLVALCENIIRVFDYQNKAEIRTFQVSQGVSLTCSSANWLQSFLYAGDLAGDVKVWNFDTGSQINQFKAHQSAISSVVSRMSVHTLMTASLDGLLKEWNLTTCELLRRVDIGEPVFQMQFISELTFFIRTQYTFSIRTLNNFYQLFNRTKSGLKKLARVQCGPDKARILATTEDGVTRFLSPVTGEMLFVTWPFQFFEKALDYVYDPDREELLVTMGTSDIYVLDTSKNPCPPKYIMRCTDNVEDKVLCLTYTRLDLGNSTFSFIFSGYKSGRVRSVTQHLFRMGGRKLHDGRVMALSSISGSGNLSYHSRESSFLCSYGADEYIILSDVALKRNGLMDLMPLVVIPSPHCRINRLLLIPGYICVLTEQNRVRLWRQAGLVPGKKNPFWKESSAMHPTTITSFDYCYNLNMLVTGGADGSVRIWDIFGQLLVEFDTSLKFSRVCFANQRGDLVVGGNNNIYFIPCVTYLPNKHLKSLSTQNVPDDTIESPLPFLPCFLLSFNIVFVPKYRQVGKQAKKFEGLEPVTNNKEVVIEKTVAKVMEFAGKEVTVLPAPNFYEIGPSVKERHPEYFVEYQILPQPPSLESKPSPAEPPLPQRQRDLPPLADTVPLYRRVAFQSGRVWPIAPDGYVPNSVIRAQMFPRGTPLDMQSTLGSIRPALPLRKVVKVQLLDEGKAKRAEKKKKKAALKMKRPSMAEGQHRRDLLAEIVSKPWLRHKPSEMTLPCITKAILDLMDDVPYSTYLLCSTALVQISESYELSPEIQEVAFNRLMLDTDHREVRMRLAAWEALGKMDLLTEKDVVPLARALLDENKKVRDMARSLLDSVAGITDKFVLKKEMQRLAESSLEDLTQMSQIEGYFPRRVRAAGIVAENQSEAVYELTEGARRLMNRVDSLLTANLFLTTEAPPAEIRRGTRQTQIKRKLLASRGSGDFGDDARPEAHGGAQARWLGLFGKDEKKAKSSYEDTKPAKLPKSQTSRIKAGLPSPKTSDRALVESPSPSVTLSSPSSPSAESSTSSTTSSSITIGSGSTWEELRQARKAARTKEKKAFKATRSRESQKRERIPKLARHPVLMQRRDTRTQLYTEMLKHQFTRKEKPSSTQVDVEKLEKVVELEAVPLRPSETGIPSLPSVSPKGSLIDPKQQYSLDRTKWRNNLYKLMTLRISPSIEGRTAAEDFLSSAKMALSGPSMSWEMLTSVTQSFLTSTGKSPQDLDAWLKYLDRLFKGGPFKEDVTQEGMALGRLPAVRERPPGSKSGVGATPISMEDLSWEMAESEEEGLLLRKKPRARGKKEEVGVLSGKERKKILKKKERGLGREVKGKPKEEVVAVEMGESAYLSEGKEWDEVLRKVRPQMSGKVREVAKVKEREVVRAKEQEQEAAKEKEQEAAGKKKKEVLRIRKSARGKEEVAKEKELEAVAKKSRLAGIKKRADDLAKRVAKQAAHMKKVAVVEEATKVRREVDEWALAWERNLKEAAEEVVAQVIHKSLIEVKKKKLAEAREQALNKVVEQARIEAGDMALERAKEIARALLKERAMIEVKSDVLEEAREAALVEAREKLLSEARQALLAEVRFRALAEAQAQVLGEGLEGVRAAARIKELAETRAAALAEARALQMVRGMEITVDEKRIMELAAKGMEVAEERAIKLAEERLMEMDEQRIWELVQPKIEELAKAKAMELAGDQLQELEVEEKQLMQEVVEAELRREELEEQLRKEAQELQSRKEDLEAHLGREGLHALLGKEGVEAHLGKEALETPAPTLGFTIGRLGKEGLEALLGRKGLEGLLGEAGLEALLGQAGLLEAQLGKEGLEALLREGLEAQLGKEVLEALLRREELSPIESPEWTPELSPEESLEVSPALSSEEEVEKEQLEVEERVSLPPEEEIVADFLGEESLWEDIEEPDLSFVDEEPSEEDWPLAEEWHLTDEEKEAFLSILDEGRMQGAEMDFASRAQLILDLLLGPEKVDAGDLQTSMDFQKRLFQVVSLLQITPTMRAESLAETLLQKAQELLQEGEETQRAEFSEKSTSILMELKKAVRGYQPWENEPRVFASKMRTLLKVAMAVMRAKSIKDQLRAEVREKELFGKMERKWKAGESKKTWLVKKIKQSMMLKQTLANWQTQRELADQKIEELDRREKRLKLRAQPVQLTTAVRAAHRVALEEAKEEEEREAALEAAREEERKDVVVRKKVFLRARQRQPILMWSLPPPRHGPWKALLQLARDVRATVPEGPSQIQMRPMAGSYRIPKNSLYLLSRPQIRQKLIPRPRKGTQHHIFRLDSKTMDWETFIKLYHSLITLKKDDKADSTEWEEKAAHLLDLYGVSNRLVRTLMHRLLMGDYRQYKFITSSQVKMSDAKFSLGQRIIYELIHHSIRRALKPPAFHGVFPLSYQNNVHPFKNRGTTRCGTMSMKWKTCFLKGTPFRKQVYAMSHRGSKFLL